MFPRDASVFRHSLESPFTYSDLLLKQEAVFSRVKAGEPGQVLLAEVAPVITLGRTSNEADLGFSLEHYQNLGIQILRTDRGGKATYHGPGQWVVFVVESLERLTGDSKGIRRATDLLLERALQVCSQFRSGRGEQDRVVESRGDCEVGVWNSGQPEKLVSLGLKVNDRILQHGLCFNGFPTPESYAGIRPCGIQGASPGWLIPSDLEAEAQKKENAFLDLQREIQSVFTETQK
jgi:lipoyl(octanoyl) transferase